MMVQFPSKVPFASFLQYQPKVTGSVSAEARNITYAIKQDSVMQRRGAKPFRVIRLLAERINALKEEFPFLSTYLGPEVVLVPAPRSSLLTKGALWPASRICEQLVAEGLGERVEPCIERTKAVNKAATAGPGQRPDPIEHFQSMAIIEQLTLQRPKAITIVDDVVTRGATFVGMFPHLQAALPDVPILCFAAIRTMSFGEIQQLRDPVEGIISFEHGNLHREP